MRTFRVEDRRTGQIATVRSGNEPAAAVKGAIKLGVRHFGKRPTEAYRLGVYLYSIYAPTKSGMSLCGNVYVWERN